MTHDPCRKTKVKVDDKAVASKPVPAEFKLIPSSPRWPTMTEQQKKALGNSHFPTGRRNSARSETFARQ